MFIFQNFLVHLFSLFFYSFFFKTTKTKTPPTPLSLFFLSFSSLSLLYSAHHVFCGVSSITDDELVFVKKKVFYTTHIRKRERDGRGL